MGHKTKNPQDLAGSDTGNGKPEGSGAGVIASLAKNLPASPGVYRMLGSAGPSGDGPGADGPKVLYVGKAKNLKKRVLSYTRPGKLSPRIQRMVAQTHDMEFVTTHTEAEALLLEANLIKKLSPKYNILLRDDKSFPEILVETDHEFARVIKHRGAHRKKGDYFGPFASAWAVNETITTLQRAFLLRTCSDAVFSSRTRPCLLFQIKRCSAPCVGKIDHDEYSRLVAQASDFLKGQSRQIQKSMAVDMQNASDNQEFELAAEFRDRIAALTRIQGHQDINPGNIMNADVVALYQDGAQGEGKSVKGGRSCMQVFFFRGGRNFGNRAFYPAGTTGETPGAVMEAFLGQFYSAHTPPSEVLLSHGLSKADDGLMGHALSARARSKVALKVPTRGHRARVVAHGVENARGALLRKKAQNETQSKLMVDLANVLGLEQTLERIEVYDNSHVSGAKAVGAMIVAGPDGFARNAYRKFNIKGNHAPGDDYAMMREVLTRRFSRAMKEPTNSGPDKKWELPDLVIVDGGKGQLGVAMEVFADLGIDGVGLCGISKGPDRNAGAEQIHLPNTSAPLKLDDRDPVLYFLQRIRDEAHRFAIGTHRAKRSKSLTSSGIDDIPGVGPGRKKALLHHFGSSNEIKDAGLSDLEAVKGISGSTARAIYDWFHPID